MKQKVRILDVHRDDSWKYPHERDHCIGAEYYGEVIFPDPGFDCYRDLTKKGWIAFFGQRIWKGKGPWGKYKFFRFVKLEIIK